jgi:hypothetical protein
MKTWGADPNPCSIRRKRSSCGSSVEKKKSASTAGVRSTNANSTVPRMAQCDGHPLQDCAQKSRLFHRLQRHDGSTRAVPKRLERATATMPHSSSKNHRINRGWLPTDGQLVFDTHDGSRHRGQFQGRVPSRLVCSPFPSASRHDPLSTSILRPLTIGSASRRVLISAVRPRNRAPNRILMSFSVEPKGRYANAVPRELISRIWQAELNPDLVAAGLRPRVYDASARTSRLCS